mmetsp:Transcript_68949/g.222860  ORF Transcript_68949/g.222860 Transcript_68949/m.222860 type:complete len:328 (-) Transcript_68949:4-987(-)
MGSASVSLRTPPATLGFSTERTPSRRRPKRRTWARTRGTCARTTRSAPASRWTASTSGQRRSAMGGTVSAAPAMSAGTARACGRRWEAATRMVALLPGGAARMATPTRRSSGWRLRRTSAGPPATRLAARLEGSTASRPCPRTSPSAPRARLAPPLPAKSSEAATHRRRRFLTKTWAAASGRAAGTSPARTVLSASLPGGAPAGRASSRRPAARRQRTAQTAPRPLWRPTLLQRRAWTGASSPGRGGTTKSSRSWRALATSWRPASLLACGRLWRGTAERRRSATSSRRTRRGARDGEPRVACCRHAAAAGLAHSSTRQRGCCEEFV